MNDEVDIICMVNEEHAEEFGARAAEQKYEGKDTPYVFSLPELQEAEDIGFAEAADFYWLRLTLAEP